MFALLRDSMGRAETAQYPHAIRLGILCSILLSYGDSRKA